MRGRIGTVMLLVAALGIGSPGAAAAMADAPSGRTAVRVTLGPVIRTVPKSFLGFSVEWTELPGFDSQAAPFAQMLRQLSVAGQPVPLRVGGQTADNTYWPQVDQSLPPSAYVVGDDYFRALAAVARAAPMSVLFDLNLSAQSAEMARAIGAEMRRMLPRASVSGFEIGNEPDLYVIGLVGNRYIKPDGDSPFQWVLGYSPSEYAADFASYVRAMRTIWPRVRYAGPSQASDHPVWARDALHTGLLSMVTLHRYEFSVCHGPTGPTYPSLGQYLSPAASRRFAAENGRFVAIARRARVPLRLTEFGSAVCGGRDGLTNTFATALWGSETIFDLLADGIDGVNVHLRQIYPNSALNPSANGINANPLFYGMLLVTRTLGPGAVLLRTAVTPSPPQLAVWATRDSRHVVRVLLLNEGATDLAASLNLATTGGGSLERLTAASPGATTGVEFAGQSLDQTGLWTGIRRAESIRPTRHRYGVAVPAYSAALLTVRR